MMTPVTPDAGMASIMASLNAIAARLDRLEASEVETEVSLEPVAAPVAEKPRFRVPAGSVKSLQKPNVISRMDQAPAQQQVEKFSPLGDSGPYLGEMFGTSIRRSPIIDAPVSSSPIQVTTIGDTHFHPGLDHLTTRLMLLAGIHVAETRTPYLRHIGDTSDFASLCRHTRNDTWKARQKPSIRQDLDSLRLNWDALNLPLELYNHKPQKRVTLGNHCAWAETFEDANPELKGLITGERDSIFRAHGWEVSAYGEFAFLGGVAFTHVPLNIMGKPAGGQTPEVTISNQVTHDLVFGHTHRRNSVLRPKMGYNNRVNVVNVGSAMPEFYVGEYAQLTQGSAVTYGISQMTIFDGRIQSERHIPWREMEMMYGKTADALQGRSL
ncbi:hypothetical protein CR162_21285 [Pseudoroseomonas rhizosphaerae]|uniref:Calcineurin-like phosphoesterase domain-containing protein n=1 Tax=Teichococcus rhizosphaerae TaxID=1335062 RepID=A0A2C7A5R0_9PROT|nr:hypothetical protein [Pseudoroseomonas rhizosphaerae]PHK92933.1 hypothetical protein CR162_21285 [Pseudoroseomonas rhizosphaerae]